MKIFSLFLKNIGPFKSVRLEFSKDKDTIYPITIITGENGSGKSIIIDALRELLLGIYRNNLSVREIIANKEDFEISADIIYDKSKVNVKADGFFLSGFKMTPSELGAHIYHALAIKSKWILDYWSSTISNDSPNITAISNIETKDFLKHSLFGKQSNVDVIKFITFLDYYRDSRDPKEKEIGEGLFHDAEQIINSSLNDSSFSHVARGTLDPIIKIRGIENSFNKLSSGSLYLIQRLISLLAKAYSAHVEFGGKISEIRKVNGLLLIDEAENHLHPKWQKKLLRLIREFFPNLQIIVTTHSPFIVSSVSEAKILVCKSTPTYSTVIDETDIYSNKPIEEILRTPLFDTDSFNIEISELIEKRKLAIQENQLEKVEEIEKELTARNPEYFRYLNIDKL